MENIPQFLKHAHKISSLRLFRIFKAVPGSFIPFLAFVYQVVTQGGPGDGTQGTSEHEAHRTEHKFSKPSHVPNLLVRI